MKSVFRRLSSLVVIGLAFCLFSLPCPADETNSLVWHKDLDRVDANVSSWTVRQLLENVAIDTGWRIYLDPEANKMVSAKFQGLMIGDALHSLLGNLNFVLVPQTNSASRLYVFRTSRQQATRLIAARKPAKPIPNELVVTLKKGSKTKIEDLAKSLNAKIIGRMDGSNTYLLQFQSGADTQLAFQELANNPDTASIGPNFPIDPPPTLLGADGSSPSLQLKPVTRNGNQIIVGLIDTPVSADAGINSFLEPAIHVAGDETISSSDLTHGTAMAETILDAIQSKTDGSTSVKILPVDVYGNSETTSTFDVANGIVQAVNNGANIINLSLGGTGDSDLLHNTIIQVTQQGVTIYAAAGNDPVTTPTYPAAYPEVISVTATDSSGNLASYANRGSFIDMTAPGDNVVGLNGQQYLVEGTSTSAAFVSGTAAGLADAAGVGASQAEALLQKSAAPSTILKPVQ
jgi:hypothetical protein